MAAGEIIRREHEISSIALPGSVVASPRTDRQRTGAGVSKGRFARIALATTVLATLANVVVYVLADPFVHYHPDFVILQDVSATVISTAIPAVVGSLLYAGLLRFTANPVRIFSAISAIVFVVTTVPDFTYIPGVEG